MSPHNWCAVTTAAKVEMLRCMCPHTSLDTGTNSTISTNRTNSASVSRSMLYVVINAKRWFTEEMYGHKMIKQIPSGNLLKYFEIVTN